MSIMNFKKVISFVALPIFALSLTACGTMQDNTKPEGTSSADFESPEGKQIRLITENTEVTVTLNDSKAAADLAEMLPLELTLIERNDFAKGMTLPERLSAEEPTTRDYMIGDFGYWNAGPDLAIFYDDIYEQTIVGVIPLGHADSGAETLRNEAGTVRLELVTE